MSPVSAALSPAPAALPAVTGAARPGLGPGERERPEKICEPSGPEPVARGGGHRGWGAQVRGTHIGQNPQPMVEAFQKCGNSGVEIPVGWRDPGSSHLDTAGV